ncbi:MAG: MFS transporter [Pseudomonadota bacterium]
MPRTPTEPDRRQLPYRVVFGWGLGSLGLSTILNTLNVLLLAYLTVVVGIEPALAGALILVAKLFDVATDLPVGWASDRTQSRWGRRRPYLLVAALVTPLSMAMLFRPPLGDPVVYVLLAFGAYTTGYTLFNVPYLSMPAELSSNTHERTAMVAHRSAFIAAGTFFGVAAAPYIVGASGGGADGYRVLGSVIGGLVFIGFVGAFVLTSWQPQAKENVRVPFVRQLRAVLSNPHFLALMFIKITHLLALAVGAGSLFFFFRYALGYDLKTLGLYGAVTTAAWAISMPWWTRIARTRGKRYGYFVATALYVLVALSWLTAEQGEALHYLIARGAVFGVVSGGMLLMGNAMLQDIMDHDMRSTGEAKNGVFAGTYSLLEKLASGVGAQILGLVLSLSGFNRAAPTQVQSAVDGVYLTASVIPAGLMLVSLYAIYRYRLDERRLD